MTTPLTPEERAYHDLLQSATKEGLVGEDALRYADEMAETLSGRAMALGHAVSDLVEALAAPTKRMAAAVKEGLRVS